MNLYLSSYGLGNYPDRLVKLAKKGSKIGVVANACDALEESRRAEKIAKELLELGMLGLQPEELDLRAFYEKNITLEELDKYDGLWVRGGNVFNLRRSMQKSGLDVILKSFIDKGKFYGGYSAGICVLSETLKGIELCDPIDVLPSGLSAAVIWKGIGILNYSIAPHYKSDHPESLMIDDVVLYFQRNNIPYKTLRDGEVIIIHKDNEELLR